MFALGGVHATNGQTQHYLDLAAELAKTCHESYQNTGKQFAWTIVHGFWPESENLDFSQKGYHWKGHLKSSRMAPISAL